MKRLWCEVFALALALAAGLTAAKAEEAVSPKAQMTMNAGNFLSNVEIFIISPFLLFAAVASGDRLPKHKREHQACQTETVNNPLVKTGGWLELTAKSYRPHEILPHKSSATSLKPVVLAVLVFLRTKSQRICHCVWCWRVDG